MAFALMPIFKKILKISAVVFLSILSLIILLGAIVHIPAVQNFAIHKATSFISDKTQTKVSVNSFNLFFFDTIELEGVYLADEREDTLLYADRISADLDFSKLFNKTIELNDISLSDARFYMKKRSYDEDYNFQFLIDAFKSKESSGPPAWEFTIQSIYLDNIHYILQDQSSGLHLKSLIGNAEAGVLALNANPEFDHLLLTDSYCHLEFFPVEGKTENNTSKEQEKENSSPFRLSFKEVTIRESEFRMDDPSATSQTRGVDWKHLQVNYLNTEIEKLVIASEGYSGTIKKLSLEEKSGFALDNLTAKVNLSLPELEFFLDDFETPHTAVNGDLYMWFPNLQNFQGTMGNIKINADLNKSRLDSRDLFYFVPSLDTLPILCEKNIELGGKVKGTFDQLQASNFSIQLDPQNELLGDFYLSGLTEPQTGNYDADIKYLHTNGQTLASLIPSNPSVNLPALGNIDLSGRISGQPTHLKVDVKTKTDAGSLDTDILVGLSNEWELESTDGFADIRNLKLGKIINQDQLGVLSANAKFRTEGEKIIIHNSGISHLDFKDYAYHDIKLNGHFKDKQFQGNISSLDTNAHLDLRVKLNLNGLPAYAVKGNIEMLDLHSLNLYNTLLRISGMVNMDMKGNEVDNITGSFEADSLTLANPKFEYFIDSVNLVTTYNDTLRTVKATSGFFNMDFEGNFSFSQIPGAARHFVSHYYSGVAYEGKEHIDSLSFDVRVEDTKGLLRMFIPEIEELEGLNLAGSWSGEQHLLDADLSINRINLRQTSTTGFNFFIKADRDKIDLRAHSGPVSLFSGLKIHKPDINGFIVKDSLFFHVDMTDSTENSDVDVEGMLALKQDTVYLNLDKIILQLKGNTWTNKGQARTVYSEDYLFIDNFNLKADTGQLISINSDTTGKNTLLANFKNVHLDEISKIAPVNFVFGGVLNGKSRIEDILGKPNLDGHLKTDQLTVDNSTLGDLDVRFEKVAESDFLKINGKLIEKIHELDMVGEVDIVGDTNAIDFKIFGRQINLAALKPFLKEYVFKLNGQVDTRMSIEGSIQNPVLSGELHFTGKNELGIQATKTVYSIRDEKLSITSKKIDLGKIALYDKAGNMAEIGGEIRHNFMKDFVFDLHLHGDNFMFLDSKEPGLIPFYGKLLGNLKMKVKGPQENIKAYVILETRKGTDLSMSLATDEATYTNPEYIRFLKPDTVNYDGIVLKKEPKKDTIDEGGINTSVFHIAGDIEVTPEARINVVVDPVNGDKISALGKGSFHFDFNTQSEMNLFGTYTVDKGSYTFTFMNLIKKEFSIDENSSISWQGDPENGTMNVTATYETKASRSALVNEQSLLGPDEQRAADRQLPVTVFLFLNGELTSPEITFDIEIPETSERGPGSGIIAERLNQIKSEPGELNKQVMGIVAFNQFLPYDSWDLQGGGGTGSIAAQSVSKALNAQLGQLTDDLGGVDIQLSVENSNSLSLETLNLMATKQITDRLSVSVGGNIGSTGTENGNTVFAGDYIIYYQLNKAGTLNLKIFSQSDPDLYLNYIQQVSGVTIQHNKKFDHLKNIF